MASFERSCRMALCCLTLAACDGTQPYHPVDEETAVDDEELSPVELAQQADEAMRTRDPKLYELGMAYFTGTTPEGSPKRLARMTRSQFDLTVQSLLPDAYAGTSLAAMPRDPLQTNYEYAENLSFNAANFTPYTDWVTALADKVGKKPSVLGSCVRTGASQTCLKTAAESFVRRSFRQVVSTQQLARFSNFYVASAAEVGLPQASADLVNIVLTSPGFVFRDEVGTDAAGRLLPAQWAQTLSYTLTDAPPDAVGITPANAARLSSQRFREQTLTKLMATPQAKRKLERFFLAWLEVKEPSEFTIASEVFPEFTPQLAAAMVEETRTFLRNTLSTSKPSLRDITQSTSSYVPRGLRAVYGLSRTPNGGRTALNPAQRLGVFTQPAVIASHSGPSTTRLVKRGVFFTRKMMCLPLGQPPQGVEASIPEDPNMSERQRIEAGTAQPVCMGCHQAINPFGFMQENYDPIGRFRTADNGKPIDASISIEDMLDEGPLTTKTSVDALRSLTSSARFQQCFVRQMFRFYMGRDEREGDDPVLRQMYFAFSNGGKQDILAALRILAGSATLSTRKDEP